MAYRYRAVGDAYAAPRRNAWRRAAARWVVLAVLAALPWIFQGRIISFFVGMLPERQAVAIPAAKETFEGELPAASLPPRARIESNPVARIVARNLGADGTAYQLFSESQISGNGIIVTESGWVVAKAVSARPLPGGGTAIVALGLDNAGVSIPVVASRGKASSGTFAVKGNGTGTEAAFVGKNLLPSSASRAASPLSAGELLVTAGGEGISQVGFPLGSISAIRNEDSSLAPDISVRVTGPEDFLLAPLRFIPSSQ